MDIDYERLTERAEEGDIEWRVRNSGVNRKGKPYAIVVPYLDARFLMARLDEACGPASWQFEIDVADGGGMMVPKPYDDDEELKRIGSVAGRLGIKIDGEWIWKADAADYTDVSAVKGGVTQAFRRAAVPWNVAGLRILYRVAAAREPLWATIDDQATYGDVKIDGEYLNWDPPRLFDDAVVDEVDGTYTPEGSRNEGSGVVGSEGRTDNSRSAQRASSGRDTTSGRTSMPNKRKFVESLRTETLDDDDLKMTASSLAAWRHDVAGDVPAEFPWDDDEPYRVMLDIFRDYGGVGETIEAYYKWADDRGDDG